MKRPFFQEAYLIFAEGQAWGPTRYIDLSQVSDEEDIQETCTQ
jgi:hypothetical protein